MHPSILAALNFESLPELVMFDLDGTLVDSAFDIAAAVDSVLQSKQQPLAGEQRVRSWIGSGAERLMRRAIVWLQEPEIDFQLDREAFDKKADAVDEKLLSEYLSLFIKNYADKPIEKTVLYPGVKECLLSLQAQQVPMALITNKPIELTWPILKGLELESFFKMVLGGDSLAEKKPSPLPLQHVMKTLLARSSQCVMVGDSKADILAAQAANVKVVAVDYGYDNGTPVPLWKPNCVVSNLSLPI